MKIEDGKPASALLAPATFDDLANRKQLLAAVQEGMDDEQAGRCSMASDEVFGAIEQRVANVEAQ